MIVVVIASNTKIDKNIAETYETTEQKDPVIIDKERISELGVELIESDLIKVINNVLRHDSIKVASIIMLYLMRD